MKTFFNVLYRRILYKIPLKLLLILLAVVAIFFASVKADNLNIDITSETFSAGNKIVYLGDAEIVCFKPLQTNCYVEYNFGGSDVEANNTLRYETNSQALGACATRDIFFYVRNSCDIQIARITNNTKSTLQCQTEYNLIPISSVDQSYCVNNNLCPASGTPGDCPNVGVSNVFINDIFHPGAFNIIINIPEEIDWDYAYTNSGSNINIDVVGYNVDYTKVQDQIDIQNFKPSDEDLSIIVSQVLPLFVPGLVVILFLYFIFRFIKKIF